MLHFEKMMLAEIGQSLQGIPVLFLTTSCETTVISVKIEWVPKNIGLGVL